MRHEASVVVLFAGLLAYAGGMLVWVAWAAGATMQVLRGRGSAGQGGAFKLDSGSRGG